MTTHRAELMILSLADHLAGFDLPTRDRAYRPVLEGRQNERLSWDARSTAKVRKKCPTLGQFGVADRELWAELTPVKYRPSYPRKRM